MKKKHTAAFKLEVALPAVSNNCKLIEQEVQKRENQLYECALAVEKDQELYNEMKEWDITLQDGLEDELWCYLLD